VRGIANIATPKVYDRHTIKQVDSRLLMLPMVVRMHAGGRAWSNGTTSHPCWTPKSSMQIVRALM
jgi:hypothetical protein